MADQVTISTFLELRDNLSEGMRKAAAAIEAATGRVRKARSDEERAAAQAAKAQERAIKSVDAMLRQQEAQRKRTQRDLIRSAEAAAREQASYQEKLTAAQWREEERRIRMAERAAAREAAASRAATAAIIRETRERTRAALRAERENERAVARAQQAMLRESMRAEKERQRIEARAARNTRLAAERAAKEQARIQQQVVAAMDRAEARKRAMAERTAKEQIRVAERAAREQTRIAERAAREQTRLAERAAREQRVAADRSLAAADKTKKGGLFGTMVGANLTTDALRMASMYGMRAVRGFYTSAIEHGKTYERQISAIAGSIFTQGLTSTYSRAKEKTVGLIDTIRKLAAKLPGEASDYVKVFTLTLPSALARGITDTQKYAEMVSKYTAIAVQRGYKGQAGYQLNEILQGRVRVTTNMFQVLAPYMGLTSREFNKITDNAERMKIVFNAIEKSAGALPAVAKDAESIFGTLTSQLEMLSVTGQFPLFESMKIAAVKLSEIISGPGLGTFVRDISTALGDLTVGAVVFFKFMFDQASRFANWIGEKLSGIPGFDAASSAFRSLREVVAFADPFQTMMKIGAEERKKWRSQEEVDIRREGRIRPHKFGEVPSAPGERAQSVVNFNNNRFEIKQEFAEGFDPDRIAFAFANDLGRLGEMKLQAAYSLTGGSVR